mmetsp:Transcript_103645/g.231530  ORF Transcript_103645/g.231530 Transcript_103645/m.231530 type:complete len:263 (+) Transcript_103645:111-899(+)
MNWKFLSLCFTLSILALDAFQMQVDRSLHEDEEGKCTRDEVRSIHDKLGQSMTIGTDTIVSTMKEAESSMSALAQNMTNITKKQMPDMEKLQAGIGKNVIQTSLTALLQDLSVEEMFYCSSQNVVSLLGNYRTDALKDCLKSVFSVRGKCASAVTALFTDIMGDSVLDAAGSCLFACQNYMLINADKDLDKCTRCMTKKVKRGMEEIVGPGAGLFAEMYVKDTIKKMSAAGAIKKEQTTAVLKSLSAEKHAAAPNATGTATI